MDPGVDGAPRAQQGGPAGAQEHLGAPLCPGETWDPDILLYSVRVLVYSVIFWGWVTGTDTLALSFWIQLTMGTGANAQSSSSRMLFVFMLSGCQLKFKLGSK